MNNFYLRKSHSKKSKYDAIFFDDDENYKIVSFGGMRPNGEPYDDYTITNDDKQKDLYIKRHQKRENFNDYMTRGALSRWVLWNRKTLKKSIMDFARRFNLNYYGIL